MGVSKEVSPHLCVSSTDRTNRSQMFFKTDILNSLSVNPTKWSNTLKQFVGEFFECI